MENIFTLFFDTLYNIWINIEKFFVPILNFVTTGATTILDIAISIIQWLIDAIVNIINFFAGLFGLPGIG